MVQMRRQIAKDSSVASDWWTPLVWFWISRALKNLQLHAEEEAPLPVTCSPKKTGKKQFVATASTSIRSSWVAAVCETVGADGGGCGRAAGPTLAGDLPGRVTAAAITTSAAFLHSSDETAESISCGSQRVSCFAAQKTEHTGCG